MALHLKISARYREEKLFIDKIDIASNIPIQLRPRVRLRIIAFVVITEDEPSEARGNDYDWL